MDLGLRDRVALVCGASRGIAFAAAEQLAREGVSLVVVSRSADVHRGCRRATPAHGGRRAAP